MTHSYFVSSSYAVKVDPVTKQETVYPLDEQGMISAKAGDVLRFKHYITDAYIPVNELMIHAGAQDVKLTLNDNTRYAWTVQAGESMGISGMMVYTMTILNACTFRYEGLAD